MTDDITRLIADAKQRGFFGSLTLTFRNGEVTLIRREETLVPRASNNNPNGGPNTQHVNRSR